MKQSPAQFYEKLQQLEREVNRLKLETYFALPPKRRLALYPEKAIQDSVREARNEIWQERYAKKVTGIS